MQTTDTESKPAAAPVGEAKLGLHLRYAFEPGEQLGATLGNPLFELLSAVLEGGSIIEAGSHEELLALDGSYSEMVELQSMEE